MTKLDPSNYIFDLSRSDYSYKGILFAEMDHIAAAAEMKCPFPTPVDYVAGIMAIIWTDEKGMWHAKMRIKFPSGNKQVIRRDYDEEFLNKVNINETYVLNHLYKMPMRYKKWYRNEDGSIDGMVKIMQDADMIERMEVYGKDEQ